MSNYISSQNSKIQEASQPTHDLIFATYNIIISQAEKYKSKSELGSLAVNVFQVKLAA
jgi:hypothetical protein